MTTTTKGKDQSVNQKSETKVQNSKTKCVHPLKKLVFLQFPFRVGCLKCNDWVELKH